MPLLAAALLLLQAPQPSLAQESLDRIRRAIGSGVRSNVESVFANPADAKYLFEMAERRGGLRRLKVSALPAPPGWENASGYWAIVHTFQDIEQDHDPVYPLVLSGTGFKLGREIGEFEAAAAGRITDSRADVRLRPADKTAEVEATLRLSSNGNGKAVVLRLNDIYRVRSGLINNASAAVVEAGETIPRPRRGDLVRAGSLLIPWTPSPVTSVTASYSGVVDTPSHDKINEKVCYLTAWWVPSLARLPHTSSVRARGPKEWIIRSEGKPNTEGWPPAEVAPGEQSVAYRCDVPISYPKVVGGMYKLAAEKIDGDKTYRSWQLEPVQEERAKRDVELMARAMRWYEANLGPWPFDGYECFDGDTYYGIESYSYTLLQRQVTTTFISHEMGHTYFGGLAPSAYVRDSWNEGMTQYVDSVLFAENRDGTLQRGLRTVDIAVPLTAMAVPWAHGSASYWRGAYVMRMLENEIGGPSVLKALRAIVADRRGKDTTWHDLRSYFEKSSGQPLDWFWDQWVSHAVFPKIEAVSAQKFEVEDRFRTTVSVRQTGTPVPYRVRFKIVVSRGAQKAERVFAMSPRQAMLSIESDFEPTEARVDVFGYSLAAVGPPVPVSR